MKGKSQFISSTLIYFAGNVLTKIISFLLLPLYTTRISAENMGYYDLTSSMIEIVLTLIFLNSWMGILRFMYDSSDAKDRYRAVNNGLVLTIMSIGASAILYLVVTAIWPFRASIWIFFYGITTILHYIYGNIARGFGENKLYAFSGVLSSAVNLTCNIILIVGFGMGMEALFISVIIGYVAQIAVTEWRLKTLRHFSFKQCDFTELIAMVKFCLPICLSAISFWFLSGFNKFAIQQSLGLSANGIYSIAGRFSVILMVLSSCFTLAWQELAFTNSNDDARFSLYRRASQYFFQFLTWGTLFTLPAIAVIFPILIASGYSSSFGLVPLSIIATVASIYNSFLNNIFAAEKRTKVIFYSTALSSVVNIIIIVALIPFIGLQAANVALLAAYLVGIIVQAILLIPLKSIFFSWWQLLLATASLGGICLCFLYLSRTANLVLATIIFFIPVIVFQKLVRGQIKAMLNKLKKA